MRRSLILVSLLVILQAPLFVYSANIKTQASAAGERPSSSPSDSLNEQQGEKGYSLPPERHEKAVAYSTEQYRLHFAGVAYSFLII
jgi:hypothetical protein